MKDTGYRSRDTKVAIAIGYAFAKNDPRALANVSQKPLWHTTSSSRMRREGIVCKGSKAEINRRRLAALPAPPNLSIASEQGIIYLTLPNSLAARGMAQVRIRTFVRENAAPLTISFI